MGIRLNENKDQLPFLFALPLRLLFISARAKAGTLGTVLLDLFYQNNPIKFTNDLLFLPRMDPPPGKQILRCWFSAFRQVTPDAHDVGLLSPRRRVEWMFGSEAPGGGKACSVSLCTLELLPCCFSGI